MKDNKTAFAILGLLSHEPMTGYDIKKRVEASLNHFWNAGFGQIYPALNLLEGRGCVVKATQVEDKRPKRIVYSITEKGMEELKGWLAEPVEKEDVKYEILLKLFFGKLSPMETNIGVIDEFRSRNAEALTLLKGYRRDLGQVMGQSQDHLYYYLTVLFGEKIYSAYLEWADEATNLLREQMKKDETNSQEEKQKP